MNSTIVKVIVGFVFGAAVGTATGLLIAPSTGRKTRKDIQKKSGKLVRQIGSYVGLIQPKEGRRKRRAPLQTA